MVAQGFYTDGIRDCSDAYVRDVWYVEPKSAGEWPLVQFVVQFRYPTVSFVRDQEHVVVTVGIVVAQHRIPKGEVYYCLRMRNLDHVVSVGFERNVAAAEYHSEMGSDNIPEGNVVLSPKFINE